MEKGEKTRLLRDVSLSGKILETLLHVRAVGNDLRFNSGRSGKSRTARACERWIAAPPGGEGHGGRSGIKD